MKYIFTLTLLLASFAQADTSLKVGGFSYHVKEDDHTNSFHRLLLLEKDYIAVGYARNSYDQDIFMASYYHTFEFTHVRVKTHFGATHGYSSCYDKKEGSKRVTCPLVAPEFEFKAKFKPSATLFLDAIVFSFDFIELLN